MTAKDIEKEIERLEDETKYSKIVFCPKCQFLVDNFVVKPEKKPALTAEEAKDFARYLNTWADCDKHPESSENGKITKYYEGYQQAVRDIIQKIGWERFEGWCGYDGKGKIQKRSKNKFSDMGLADSQE